MGKTIEKIALEAGHSITLIIDSEADWAKSGQLLGSCDVSIDFSTPDVVVSNIGRCFTAGIPVVVGTTAWESKQGTIRELCLKGNHTIFVASNFSIGVNIFNKINRNLATLMNDLPQYDCRIEETHHVHKIDAPSGTAKVLANDIIKEVGRKKIWMSGEPDKPEQLGIKSHRIGEVPGMHSVNWFSDEDEIEIIHRANNRFGFAKGALLAAAWLIGKKGFFGMSDMLFH